MIALPEAVVQHPAVVRLPSRRAASNCASAATTIEAGYEAVENAVCAAMPAFACKGHDGWSDKDEEAYQRAGGFDPFED